MSVKEQVIRTIKNLSEPEIHQVAEYLAFMKFRERVASRPIPDRTQLGSLYGEFAEEDRFLAEQGIEAYAEGLASEDEQ